MKLMDSITHIIGLLKRLLFAVCYSHGMIQIEHILKCSNKTQ